MERSEYHIFPRQASSIFNFGSLSPTESSSSIFLAASILMSCLLTDIVVRTDIQLDRQTDRQIDRQTDRQTDGQPGDTGGRDSQEMLDSYVAMKLLL